MNDQPAVLVRFLQRLRLPSSVLLTGIVGYLDFLTGPYLSLLLFYLIPISVVSWYGKPWQGVLLTGVSASIWLLDAFITPFVERTPALAVWNIALRQSLFLIVVHLLAKLKWALEHERILARTDPLTRVYNRRYFAELLMREYHRTCRYHHPFTVAYLDLDNFKRINDHFGHSTGDRVLVTVAATLQQHLRQTDAITRLGGDEFAFLLPETRSEAAQLLCRRVHRALRVALADQPWLATCSIGAITYIDAPMSSDEVLRITDRDMYAAKQRGKAQLVHTIYAQGHEAAIPSH